MEQSWTAGRALRLVWVTVLLGVGAGLAGLAIILVLHTANFLAFGYTTGSLIDAVENTPPERRLVVLVIAGVVGAAVWYLLRRRGAPIVTDDAAVAGASMPVVRTTLDSLLQILLSGLGASIGRELAPRQLGALVGAWLGDKTGLTGDHRRALVACGAGAGLAAVYNVPLGGAIFALEVLFLTFRVPVAAMALATSAIAALIGSLVLPDAPLFEVERMTATPSLVIWALLAGPIFGAGGALFSRAAEWMIAHRPKGRQILWIMPVAFAATGVVAWFVPHSVGDGDLLSEFAFDPKSAIGLVLLLFLLKFVMTVGLMGAGAAGGTLTPSIALGAALGAVLGGVWGTIAPGTPIAAFAIVGAAAFLASAIRAPFASIILVIEFTGQGLDFYIPVIAAVTVATLVGQLIQQRRVTGAF